MHHASIGRRSLRAVLAAVFVAIGLSALAPSASAASKRDRDLSNSVALNVQGGDAFALAACLNVIAAHKNASDNIQANDCANHAVAVGGDVVLKNVRLTAVQLNSPDGNVANAANSVNLSIQGGNAAALAACANVILAGHNANDNVQANDCTNVAFAQGGNVILKNVRIKVVQVNGPDGGSSVPNSVSLNIAGGNAFAAAACLNVIAAGSNANDNIQTNDCANHAVAVGGDVVLKNVRLTAVQLDAPTTTVSNAANSVNVTIQGGNAAAIAACANVILAGNNANANYQQNDCTNVAFARGGNVVLKNVRIKVVQAG